MRRRAARRAGLVVLGLSLLLAGCGATGHDRLADVDDEGALLGAYVSPESATAPGRIEALEAFENLVGQPLGVALTYHPFEDPFPDEMDEFVVERDQVLLLSWGGTDTQDITSGRYDDMVRERARALSELDSHILLRWRWEMNRPNLREEIGGPESYRAAWRHLRGLFEEVGVGNVDWLWCPLANDFDETDGPAYYPGDEHVDWLCADAYPTGPEQPLSEVMRPFMRFAAEHPDKPVVIAEFGTTAGGPGARADWLDEALAYVRSTPSIKAALYYESDNAPAGEYAIKADDLALSVLTRAAADPYFTPDWAR